MLEQLQGTTVPLWVIVIAAGVLLLVAVYRSRARLHRAQAQLEAMRALHRQIQHRDP